MLKRTFLALCALSLVLTASCGASFRQIQVRTVAEAEYLQAEASAKGVKGDEIAIADGFLARAKSNNSAKESADLADLATAYYKIALARHSANDSAAALKRAQTALMESEEQVATYQDVLTRVNANAGRD
ncbi:MAG: hypothetical protein FWC23_09030 [Chitinispirillia bacterium]|nr:hypothetical protein [Chitinispirillia bacterium]MCL2269311.1 hypothetical protein [Chitinispirillia bacterium]